MKKVLFPILALVLAFGLALPMATPAGASPGLVGEWHLDEGSGQIAGDTTTVNNGQLGSTNGSDVNDPTWVSGKFGQALSFDGTDDYVSMPDSASLEPSAITVEAWINISGDPGYNKYIVSKHYNLSRNSYALRAFSSGLEFYIGTTSTYYPSPRSAPVWDGNWHHVMGTFDGSYVRLYVDGSEVGMGTPVPGGTSIAYDGAGVKFGVPGDPWIGQPYHFGGKIDEVRIWDTAHPPLHVDDDGAQYATPYTTIQAAVDAASPGDNIIVHPGTYTENVDVTKNNLTITSTGGASATMVDGSGAADEVFEVVADGVTIDGFEITMGRSDGGIKFEGDNNVFANNHVHHNNRYGIVAWDDEQGVVSDNNKITRNDIHDNVRSGILIGFWGNSGNEVTHNKVYGNGSDWVGIELVNSKDSSINHNEVHGSSAVWGGILLFTWTDDVEIGGNSVVHNDVNGSSGFTRGSIVLLAWDDGGSFHGFTSSDVNNNDNTVAHNNVYDNTGGKGIRLWAFVTDGKTVSVDGNDIHHNTVTGNTGGYGIHLSSGSDLNTVHHNTLTGNTAGNIVDGGSNNKLFKNKLS